MKRFCIGKQDELLNNSLLLLQEAKTAIAETTTSTQLAIQKLLEVLIKLKSDIDKSNSGRVQNWFAGLLNESLEILRGMGFFDVLFKPFSEMTHFDDLLKLLGTNKTLAMLLWILRELDGFDESTDNALWNMSKMRGFDESRLNEIIGKADTTTNGNFSGSAFSSLINLTAPLSLPPSKQPANSLLLDRKAAEIFDVKKDALPQILTAFNKDIGTKVYQAWASTTVTEPSAVKIYAFRVTAPLFGNSVQPRILEIDRQPGESLRQVSILLLR